MREFKNLEIILLSKNFGIAYAQNIGIKQALKKNADYILLSDQDTIYPNNYVKKMFIDMNILYNCAAIAPLYENINQNNQCSGFVGSNIFRFYKFYPTDGYYDIAQAISSGTMLNGSFIGSIGLMNEDLFIDWVDLEWCWRATSLGYRIVGNANVKIKHRLGDKTINFFGKKITIRNQLRHYYIVRNGVYLALSCKSISKLHRVYIFYKSLQYLIVLPLLTKPRNKYLQASTLAFLHGVLGKLGMSQQT